MRHIPLLPPAKAAMAGAQYSLCGAMVEPGELGELADDLHFPDCPRCAEKAKIVSLTLVGVGRSIVVADGNHPDTIDALRDLRDELSAALAKFGKVYATGRDVEFHLLDARGRDVDRDGAVLRFRSEAPIPFMDYSSGETREFSEAEVVRVRSRRPILVIDNKWANEERFLRALPGVRLEELA